MFLNIKLKMCFNVPIDEDCMIFEQYWSLNGKYLLEVYLQSGLFQFRYTSIGNSSDTTKNSGIGIGEYLNPRSDPIQRSYTIPIVMPASFA